VDLPESSFINQKDPLTVPIACFGVGMVSSCFSVGLANLIASCVAASTGPIGATIAGTLIGISGGVASGYLTEKKLDGEESSGITGAIYGGLGSIPLVGLTTSVSSVISSSIAQVLGGGFCAKLVGAWMGLNGIYITANTVMGATVVANELGIIGNDVHEKLEKDDEDEWILLEKEISK